MGSDVLSLRDFDYDSSSDHESSSSESKEKDISDKEEVVPSDDDDDVLCSACFERPPNLVFDPCGHYTMCRRCAAQSNHAIGNGFRCPVCQDAVRKCHKLKISPMQGNSKCKIGGCDDVVSTALAQPCGCVIQDYCQGCVNGTQICTNH